MTGQSFTEAVVGRFVGELRGVSIARDPDGVLSDEVVIGALQSRGFDILVYEDAVSFRFEWETRCRRQLREVPGYEVIVVDRGEDGEGERLPFDVLRRAGAEVRLGLAELFEQLSPAVVRSLDGEQRERLFHEMRSAAPPAPLPLNETRTLDFVLDRVFGVPLARVAGEAAALARLLRFHSARVPLPAMLLQRCAARMAPVACIQGVPLVELLADRGRFISFVQTLWAEHVLATIDQASASIGGAAALGNGSSDLLQDADVRAHLVGFFLDGELRPIVLPPLAVEPALLGLTFGVVRDSKGERRARVGMLLDRLENEVPTVEDRHPRWLAFAQRYAELSAERYAEIDDGIGSVDEARSLALGARVDARFRDWMLSRFSTLSDQPPRPAVMVHHVVRYMAARRRSGEAKRLALLLLDGLSLDQWAAIRNELDDGGRALSSRSHRVQERAVFAWVPTLTNVSRQAAFAGTPPARFRQTFDTTGADEAHFRRFWEDEGLEPEEIRYARSVRDPSPDEADRIVGSSRIKALGIVVDKVDLIMHGMEQGVHGMHQQVRQWCRKGSLRTLIDVLLASGFEIHLTSDHGNLEARGVGRPGDGLAAEHRGERVRFFGDRLLRARFHESIAGTIEWPGYGLPPDRYALLAGGRDAFVAKGEGVVAHGGISIEEVIVPWIEIGAAAQGGTA